MKLFYLVPNEMLSSITFGYRGLDLGTGKSLVCINWTDELEEKIWSEREGVVCLPHPIFESNQPLAAEHIKHLSGRYQVNEGNDIHHVLKQAAKEDIGMRLRVL